MGNTVSCDTQHSALGTLWGKVPRDTVLSLANTDSLAVVAHKASVKLYSVTSRRTLRVRGFSYCVADSFWGCAAGVPWRISSKWPGFFRRRLKCSAQTPCLFTNSNFFCSFPLTMV